MRLIHNGPLKVRTRDRFDYVLRRFWRCIALWVHRFELNIYFDIWTFDGNICPLESIGTPTLSCENLGEVFALHARLNLTDLSHDFRNPCRSLLCQRLAHWNRLIPELRSTFGPLRQGAF